MSEKTTEWFVVAGNKNSNDGLMEQLAARGFGHDAVATSIGVVCHDGKRRDFLRIPGSFVTMIKRIKKGSDVLVFRFWKRNGPNALAYPADFVEQSGVYQSSTVRSVVARITVLKATKK